MGQGSRERYRLRANNVLCVDSKPYLISSLVKAGVLESHAKTFTVERAYVTLYRILGRHVGQEVRPGFRAIMATVHALWLNGIPLDTIKDMSLEDRDRMRAMIQANTQKKD